MVRSVVAGLCHKVPLMLYPGGTNSGKTFGIVDGLIQYGRTLKEETLITISAVALPYIKNDSLSAFQEITAKCGIPYTGVPYRGLTYKIRNAIYEFKSFENKGKASHGKRQILYMNEAPLFTYPVYEQLQIRSDIVIMDWNPHEEWWLQEKIVPFLKNGKYLFKRTTYRDNPNCPPEIIDKIESLKESNPNLYRVLGLGMTGQLEGLVFPNVGLCDDFPEDCRVEGYGLDFGFSNHESALTRFGLKGGAIYLDEMFYRKGMSNKMIVDEMINLGITERDIIVADAAEPKSIAEIKDHGFMIEESDKSTGPGGMEFLKYSIGLLNQYPIYITRRSVNIRKEQKNYRYKEDRYGNRINEPIKMFDHAFAGARYIGRKLLKPIRTGRNFLST